MKAIPIICCLLISMNATSQINLYVDSSRVVSGAGTSWATAYRTFGEALTTANAGNAATKCNIYLAKGNYFPTGIQTATNRDSSFVIARANIAVRGGYAAGGGSRDPGSFLTALNGNIGAANTNADNTYRVLNMLPSAGLDSVLLDGVLIVNANGGQNSGGAVLACGNPVIFRNCVIKNNKSESSLSAGGITSFRSTIRIENSAFSNDSGGAVKCEQVPSVTVTGCSFLNNFSPYGPGVNVKGLAHISDCIFLNNNGSYGGAIYVLDVPSPTDSTVIVNCTFRGNSGVWGGAIHANSRHWIDVMNCSFDSNRANNFGGAIFRQAIAASKIRVRNCNFTNNTTGIDGGAFYNSAAGSTDISGCLFSENTATGIGGSIHTIGSANLPDSVHVRINGNQFKGNEAEYGAALACLSKGNFKIENNTFRGNSAQNSGGGLYVVNADQRLHVINNEFSGNKALFRGGGICDTNSSFDLINCSFNGDTAATGNGIFNRSSTIGIKNCIVWDGAGNGIVSSGTGATSINYSLIQGGAPGIGNMSADPVFWSAVPATNAPTATGDLHLLHCSPAINTGSNTAYLTYPLFPYTPPTTDAGNNNRFYGTGIDMGAYEVGGLSSITGPDSICRNSTATFSTSLSGGIWSSADTSTAKVTAMGTVSGNRIGTTKITYRIVGTGGCVDSVVKTIKVNGVNNATSITGNIIRSLQDSATYKWMNCATRSVLPGQTGQALTVSATGQYAVIVLRNGCVDTSTCATVNGLGVQSVLGDGVEVYPNPTTGIINIKTNRTIDVHVSSIDGKQLANGTKTESVNISQLPAGIYWLQIYDHKNKQLIKAERIIKE